MNTSKRKTVIDQLILLGVACALSGCSSRESHRAQPNVILIVMDTVRADHLGCYGYDRPISPNIDAFAKTATLYARGIASSPWSMPSHASLFTGKDPFQHGAHRMQEKTYRPVSREFAKARVTKNPLHWRHMTLAQMFWKEGYRTAAFVANDGYLSPKWRLTRGFETYHAQFSHADVINQRVFEWLETMGGKPFFLFINYMDAHKPYNTTPREGLFSEPVDRSADLPDVLLKYAQSGGGEISEDLRRQVVAQYDTGIANLDEQLGRLMQWLREKDLFDTSIIVLTADHGEAFGEHGYVLHGNDVYEPEVWVPIIVKRTGQTTPVRVGHPASTSDIPRLILQDLGAETAKKYESDFPNVHGSHPVVSENYYATRQTHISSNIRVRTAIYDWPYKYIHSSDGMSELYDLEGDSKETVNLLEVKSEVARKMTARLEEYIMVRGRANTIMEEPRLTPDELRKLKTLGYIGN